MLSGQCRINSNSQPLRNMLPPSLPTLKESSSPEVRILGSSVQDEAAPAQQGSGQLSSAPIVLSRQNSSSSEGEDAASEPEAAGQLSVSSEEADSAGGSEQTTVSALEQAESTSGDFPDGQKFQNALFV